jgi:PAS domain S-box-containing protein
MTHSTAKPGELAISTAVLEAAPDAVVVSRHGVVVWANRAAAALLGLATGADLVGLNLSAFIGEPGAALMRQRVEAILRGVTGLSPLEYEATRQDGSKLVGEVTSTVVDYDGAPAVVAFVRDVTERTRLREQIARADRLAALGTASAGMAHEINNPLQIATLASDALDRRLLQDEESAKLLRDLRGALERIGVVVRDLRGFSRFSPEPMSIVDIGSVLGTAARFVHHQIPPRVELSEDWPRLPSVPGNARQLEQVVVNLLMNALQAFPPDGGRGRITLRGGQEGDDVVVSVEDDGQGIPQALLGRVFDPFFTTKPPGVGTGLGLAVCHGIVTRHGGSISIDSTEGRGTTVRVRLPRARSAQPPRRRGTPFPANAPRGLRVLVVDDEPSIVRMVTHLLAGNDVVGVTDGAAAVEHLMQDDFDVVLCDLGMRPVTGRDVYETVRNRRPDAKARFVFMTGGAYLSELGEFVESTGQPLLEKPFSVGVLHAALYRARV